MSGQSHGYDDANTWIDELRTADHLTTDAVRDRIAALLRAPITADESLINGVTTTELAKLVGADVYDDDGMTAEATAWFAAYNDGWREACEAKVAELTHASH